MTPNENKEYFFKLRTPLGYSVHTTRAYWERIVTKHPELHDKLEEVKKTLQYPDEIRRSKRDEMIFLFYAREIKHWLCVVTKKIELEGFLVTAYITDSIKEGEILWRK